MLHNICIDLREPEPDATDPIFVSMYRAYKLNYEFGKVYGTPSIIPTVEDSNQGNIIRQAIVEHVSQV